MIFPEIVPTDHWIGRIDGRLKMALTLALLVMVVSYQGFAFQLLVAALCLMVCYAMKVPWKAVAKRFSEPVFLILVIGLLKIFFSEGVSIFSFHVAGVSLTASREGLMEGLMIGSRILAAVTLMAVLAFSTPFMELMAALSWFRIPRGFVEVLLYAYRYIFVLTEDAEVIYNAQKNRLGYAAFRRRFSSLGVLTGSLVLKAFENSQNVTTAMIQRGYNGHIPLMRHRPLRSSEVFLSLLFITAMGALWTL